MGSRNGRSGEGDEMNKEAGRRAQAPFGGLDDTGGLGAPDSSNSVPPAGRSSKDRTVDPSEAADPGTYEDANITGTDVTGGMGRTPRGQTPGRTERLSDDPRQQDDSST